MSPTLKKLLLAVTAAPIAAATGWLVAAVGKYGISLSPSGVTAAFVAGTTLAGAVAVKLIHDLDRTRLGEIVTGEVHTLEARNPGVTEDVKRAIADAVSELERRLTGASKTAAPSWFGQVDVSSGHPAAQTTANVDASWSSSPPESPEPPATAAAPVPDPGPPPAPPEVAVPPVA